MASNKEIIQRYMAKAFFASAWADQCEEAGNAMMLAGKEITELMPRVCDPAAIHAAQTLLMDMERANGQSITNLFRFVKKHGAGDRPNTPQMFGHYCAMQAMGHGVGLDDAFGDDVSEAITVPYVEFSQCSLERDYFTTMQTASVQIRASGEGRELELFYVNCYDDSKSWWIESYCPRDGHNEVSRAYMYRCKPVDGKSPEAQALIARWNSIGEEYKVKVVKQLCGPKGYTYGGE